MTPSQNQSGLTRHDDMPWQGILIGWKECVEFPDWDVGRIKVKIDTGARTSALDVVSYTLRSLPGGGLSAQLRLALDRKRPDAVRTVEAPVLRMVMVANSSGSREERPLIEARIKLGPVTKIVPVTITNRTRMLFPMIFGRKALEGDFVVDVSRKYVLGRHRV